MSYLTRAGLNLENGSYDHARTYALLSIANSLVAIREIMETRLEMEMDTREKIELSDVHDDDSWLRFIIQEGDG